MDGYQFIAAITQSLVSMAWPVAFVISVALFRGRLTQLLPFLRFKHKETEISFRLDQAEIEVKQIPVPIPANPPIEPTPEEKSRYEQIAELSPRAAILEKRSELEQTLHAVAQPYLPEHKRESGRGVSLLESIRVLRQAKIIDETTSALLDDLRAIGNQAAHRPNEPEVNEKKTALRFGKLVDTLIQYMNMLI